MTAISLAFLVVCIFGAFAYGSSTVMALRQVSPVWGPPRWPMGLGHAAMDRVSLSMFALCTAWFVFNALAEYRKLGGASGDGFLDLMVLGLSFLFPPLIMHVVWKETCCHARHAVAGGWGWPVGAMYILSPLVDLAILAMIFGLVDAPLPLGASIGISLGTLFTLASVYSTALMLRSRQETAHSADWRLDNAMVGLFVILIALFFSRFFLDDTTVLVEAMDRFSRITPIFFLIVAVYFENPFEFYDLVIKRGVMLVITIVVLGVIFTMVQPFIEGLPEGYVRPWLAAMVLVPIVMLIPWLYGKLSAGLDRLWFGRTFSAVEAVKHVLGAMQNASSEEALTIETERRMADIFGGPIAVRVDDQPSPDGAGVEVDATTPSGGRVRFVAVNTSSTRLLLSEDLAMLRSLAGVFGFMLETVRLQLKRQEQELIAHDLRLQTSRSELKALRAQINPHFLFNALNAIASLIHTDPLRADEAVEQLAEVFRYTLRRSDSDWAPLDQELAFARAYLDVEQARFGQRLTCTIDSDHLPPVPQVPSMLLQTLIENAVKHGVSQTRGPGRIDVIVRSAADSITVEVRDNGPGLAEGGAASSRADRRTAGYGRRRDGEGFGLRSVRERLAGHFGDRASLTLTRDEEAGMTVARITMPVARVAA